jgi:hypothetical protein
VRPTAPENAWHLYDDEVALRFTLQRAGFEPERNLGSGLIRYRRVGASGLAHAVRGVRDTIILRTPLGSAVRKARRRLRRFGI